ncbi:hypothetical protein BA766_15580 [Stenotrophomonas maltophilia]|uniref:hypothetical protein n=1 Tax=Stenotrophomonas maltophilia TaxID=40324 RepID=UPI000810AE3A|nr:hypothetical protein [Stenotrophomonas maltophilia]OCK46159.1 hypothetical protein BA766_15580 [Stenotrophomonas maltophilia]
MILEFQTAAQAVKAGADLLRGVLTADKALSEAEWKLKLADAISLLADARMAIVDAGDKAAELNQEIARLTEALSNRTKVVRFGGMYYEKGSDGVAEGEPYCPHCFEAENRLIHLVRNVGKMVVQCPKCKTDFDKRMAAVLPDRPSVAAEVTPPQKAP